MIRRHLLGALLLTLSGVRVAAAPAPVRPSAGAVEYFEKHVRPVLAEQCYPCHGPRLQQGGLRLDRPDFLRSGGTNPLVRPGDPEGSRLIQAVRHVGGLRMPPSSKLPSAQIDALADWVKAGAAWPLSGGQGSVVGSRGEDKARHWSFQPVKQPAVPVVKNSAWVKTPIDAFVLANLEKRGLQPAPPADCRTLIRRAYYDLTGLPPTAEEVEAFERECDEEARTRHGDTEARRRRAGKQSIATRQSSVLSVEKGKFAARATTSRRTESSGAGARRSSPTVSGQTVTPRAYARLIDRLLASPQYGERWGRYWLDVARYADTRGYVRLAEERLFPYAYTYRDYVVRAFNEDKPYNRFILEQLAADQLPQGSADLSALGYLTLGRRFTGNRHDIIDDRIDVVSRGLLGLTVTCARCHNHKYDPIPTADYYSLYGVFASSEDPAYPPLTGRVEGEALRAHFQEFEKRKRAAEQRESRAFDALLHELRARSGDYLVRALDGPQPPQQPLPHKPGEIRQYVVERWIDTLRDSAESRDPTFAAWHAFAALDKTRFPVEAAALVTRWKSAAPDAKMNARVRSYFVEHPPTTMTEVARGYGKLLEAVQKAVVARTSAASDRADGLINGSFEADGPTVNTALRGWKLTGARLVTLGTEGTSDGELAAVFADGLPGSAPPTAHGAELSQVVPTQAGAAYRVSWDYGAFGSGAPEVEQALRVQVRGQSVLATRTVMARGSIPSMLKPYELTFVAEGASVTLAFADVTSNGESGLADGVLDNVKLEMLRDAAGNLPVPKVAPAVSTEVSPADRPFYDLLYAPKSPISMTQNQAIDNYLYDAPVNAEIYRLRNAVGTWLAQTGGAPLRAHTLVELLPSRDARILIRGNPQRPGDRVSRQFLAALSGPRRQPFTPERARLDLARAIVRSDNPLTARVMVNRVWQHHFGEGLVRTPSDFGIRGERPTHPALLDWLAAAFSGGSSSRFRVPGELTAKSDPKLGTRNPELNWSIKALHRLIMLSSAYQQSSREMPGSADPENRLLGRMSRHRLDVEAFRDSVLHASGLLDLRQGGPAGDLLDPANRRRTLYASIDRQNLPGMLRLFDFASPDAHASQRHTTTVPLQGLFLLNSPFMEACSQALADRSAISAADLSDEERVQALYRLALARKPSPAELQRGIRFVEGGLWAELAQVLLLSNEFAFVD